MKTTDYIKSLELDNNHLREELIAKEQEIISLRPKQRFIVIGRFAFKEDMWMWVDARNYVHAKAEFETLMREDYEGEGDPEIYIQFIFQIGTDTKECLARLSRPKEMEGDFVFPPRERVLRRYDHQWAEPRNQRG